MFIELRSPSEDDMQRLMEIRNDRMSQELLMISSEENTLSSVREWVKRKSSVTDSELYVISDKRSLCKGYVQLFNICWAHRRAYLGICIHHDSRGEGIGATAMCLAHRIAYDDLLLKKILLEVEVSNQVALNLYKSLGYCPVGVMKNHYYINESWKDMLLMEKWLSDG